MMNPNPIPPSFYHKSDITRVIHIWEFPKDFRVRLDEAITRELVDRATESVGGMEQLARVLKKGVTTVYRYRAQTSFISIASLLKLCELAGAAFAIERLEPRVVAYKGGTSAKPIRNPHLPLVETPDLFALMGHLAGDGGYSGTAYYYNTSGSLIVRFLGLLRGVFGDVPVYIAATKRNESKKKEIGVLFGCTIVRLLRHIYQTDFRTYTARVPQRLFELPSEYAGAFLRAFGDDEGCVTDGQIIVCSANKKLIQDIYALVLAKFPELGEFAMTKERKRKRKNAKWSHLHHIEFQSGAFKSYRAFIGFTHPEKKQELDRNLARRARGWRKRSKNETRTMLLTVLSSSTPMTVKDLTRKLSVTKRMVWHYLKGKNSLIALGFVRVRRGETGPNGSILYEITERGRKILPLCSIGFLESGSGRRKLEILKTLAGAGEGLVLGGLMQRLGLPRETVRNHLNGRLDNKTQGLVELGLVERSGRGRKADPYVYHLTAEGEQVAEALETLFPAI